jgi:hypothetical protein
MLGEPRLAEVPALTALPAPVREGLPEGVFGGVPAAGVKASPGAAGGSADALPMWAAGGDEVAGTPPPLEVAISPRYPLAARLRGAEGLAEVAMGFRVFLPVVLGGIVYFLEQRSFRPHAGGLDARRGYMLALPARETTTRRIRSGDGRGDAAAVRDYRTRAIRTMTTNSAGSAIKRRARRERLLAPVRAMSACVFMTIHGIHRSNSCQALVFPFVSS